MGEAEGEEKTDDKRLRIALCHLESVVCLPAVDELFRQFRGEIGLVVLSKRFGGKHGGILRQLASGVRRSGLMLTLWLGFDIVAARILAAVACSLGLRCPTLKSVRALALEHGAQVIEAVDVNRDCVDTIRAYGPDFLLVMNFDQILGRPLIGIPAYGVMNIHPSLLPRFRGPCPVLWAFIQQSTDLGVTLHFIDGPGIDSGPIVSQWKTTAASLPSVAEATSFLFLQGVKLLTRFLADRQSGLLAAQSLEADSYQSFPTLAQMRVARRFGTRLFTVRYVARLICACMTPVKLTFADT